MPGKGLPQSTGRGRSVVEREEERPFGVISQTLSNMLGCEKGEKPGITGSQGKICLVRKKKKSGARFGQPCLESLPHGSDQEKKQGKSIRRMQGNKNVQ